MNAVNHAAWLKTCPIEQSIIDQHIILCSVFSDR